MSVITNVEGNDTLGDCVLAEEAHFVGVMTGNAGTLYAYTADQTIAAYSAITGYDPVDPSTDQGTDPIVDLNYWCAHPYADGTTLAGYAEVDATNQAEVQFAISAFGNLKIWGGLPDAWTNPFPSGNGFVWDVATPDMRQGHCIGSCAYNSNNVAIVGANSQGVQVMTWGYIGTITWAAFPKFCSDAAGGGCAVRITTDWVNKNSGQTPSGLAYADLINDFNKLFGGKLPSPSPSPSPTPPAPPAPAPTAPPTLAQAQAAVAGALGTMHPLLVRDQAVTAASEALAPLWPSP
jgi:hypothetical protein